MKGQFRISWGTHALSAPMQIHTPKK